MQGYTGSLNSKASVNGHSQPAGPSTSTTQECFLSPASSSMALFAHHAQAVTNPNHISTMTSGIDQVSHEATNGSQNPEIANQMALSGSQGRHTLLPANQPMRRRRKLITPVRIDNSSSLETWAREKGSNPKPGFLWTPGPVDCRTAYPRFSGIELSQADTKCINPCSKERISKEIIPPNGGLITATNVSTDLATISFINLKSTPATNQESTQERGTGLQPSPMTSTLKLDDHAAKLRIWTT
ncbi:hypothetical protein DSO57_1002554 [Entomophthora muscae]|uniref:Uncharacterized protein n=1 Tax=Entomophthora muscae TaxID=34485 RepID=A0ACC2T8M8_9FUNG|nr:hypothetical protein DSO57_1002554 [Entomophthora muscae]